MLKILIAIVLMGHGIGHSMGLLQIFKVATITIPKNHQGPAQLQVTGMPPPKAGQVYEIWLKHGDQLQPGPLFNVDSKGNGAGAIPDDLEGVSTVLVTREQTGGAQKPSEAPIISARI